MARLSARRRNNPWLAVIVISLLVVMGLFAWKTWDGDSQVAPDSGVAIPQDTPETAPINPNPNPGAPVPERR